MIDFAFIYVVGNWHIIWTVLLVHAKLHTIRGLLYTDPLYYQPVEESQSPISLYGKKVMNNV